MGNKEWLKDFFGSSTGLDSKQKDLQRLPSSFACKWGIKAELEGHDLQLLAWSPFNKGYYFINRQNQCRVAPSFSTKNRSKMQSPSGEQSDALWAAQHKRINEKWKEIVGFLKQNSKLEFRSVWLVQKEKYHLYNLEEGRQKVLLRVLNLNLTTIVKFSVNFSPDCLYPVS